ncbi:site-specific integrase [Amycolatopsis saalfeldensis]|uniref:Site-specific recombinase XerD n=1 Tax=Amycolatopsis saalfeldensis TaxID=394193 RepID=A0A1H8Y2D1_9PSEU|nr:site-specific integrase [Amycolatopsis saalfeldensis]SEP46460.1 Site-specific recombinase XerD [Amycolatopsis saalfeldensis]
MPRPPMPLGTWGKVRTYARKTGGHRATALYKDYDGVARPVERAGASAAKATNALLEALRDRSRATGDAEITAETKVSVVAEMYFEELAKSDKATRTKQDYKYSWNGYLKRPLANLTVRQAGKVSMANRVLTSIRDKNGSGAAKTARSVLTGIYALMVRHDALEDNPVREIESLGKRSKGAKPQGRIDATNVGGVLGLVRASEAAAKWDLVDILEVLAGLGCRIGELLALDWATSIDFDDGTIYFHGTVIRVKGVGLIVQPYTKSPAGMRRIRPPSWVMDVLKGRYATATSEWAFPTSIGTLRDPDNTRRDMRKVIAGTEFEGLVTHDWRHYVATILDDAGLTARQIADYLGHDKPSTTQDVYMSRGTVSGKASAALHQRPPVKPMG